MNKRSKRPVTETRREDIRAKVLLVDDHAVVRMGIAQLIRHQPDLMVCAQAEDAPPPPPGGHSTTIDVANNSFSPTPDTIPAGTITFHWVAGAVTHNVTWTSGPTPPTGSGNRAAGDADYAPTVQAGTYTYHCTIHAAQGMSGTLVVTP